MTKKLISAFLLIFALMTSIVVADNSGLWMAEEYTLGGAQPYYVAESYYAVPIVEDLNKDGKKEIIFGNYSINVLDAASGSIVWRVNGGKDRSTEYKLGNDIGFVSDIAVTDIDSDGRSEIITSHANGFISVLTNDGYFKPGWPKQLKGAGGTVYAVARSLEVSDLDNDGYKEIIVGASTASAENVWVYGADGNLLPGWPQLENKQNALVTHDLKSGYSYGVFMDGVASGDITGDGIKEVIVATDTGYICAYDIYGKLVPANKRVFGGRTWGKVALWESEKTETNMNFNEGWGWNTSGKEPRSELYKGELGHAVIKVCDIDNNGTNEVITSAIILDKHNNKNPYTGDYNSSKYMTFFIFNGDRTRYTSWSSSPSDMDFMGAPLIQNANDLSSLTQAEPVVADLNNDGINEILLNTYDGLVHAFSINDAKREFGSFPYRIPQSPGTAETAGGVVCKDIDGDGTKEVIFATFTDDATHSYKHNKKGSIYILNSNGTLMNTVPIPDGYQLYETKRPAYTNSALAKICVEDVDNDGAFEVVINTRYAGIAVFEIKGSKTWTYAQPKQVNIKVDNRESKVSAYNINGYNYFKLRDVAALLNNTSKQFNVDYKEKINCVRILPEEPYSSVGGELKDNDSTVKNATVSPSTILIRNSTATCTPYMIDGNNYFKLRDVCTMAGAEVEWDSSSETILISTR